MTSPRVVSTACSVSAAARCANRGAATAASSSEAAIAAVAGRDSGAKVASTTTSITAATRAGTIALMTWSPSSCASSPSRESSSPRRSRVRASSVREASAVNSEVRSETTPRSATSWVSIRSSQRNTPRETPRARTITTATVRSSTGGMVQARVTR